ncbi:MAG: hypothetical protein GWO20_01200 [Candidatus Korarchaeota archaeon]|nr:hypothetical protein [Candidatus Korarchaeota archaeon]NIU83061.1 hypothetical protein [Candidatus Thorarchaeota archaeon]NIW12605.1 hypothetical protein [Candidatus Thorarchaeota archaeon]NIW50816.1 hypothetical protein [Candidatus Korarchaeota archaeon]
MERQFYKVVTIFLIWTSIGWFSFPFLVRASTIAPDLRFPRLLLQATVVALLYACAGIITLILGRYRTTKIQSEKLRQCPQCKKRIRADAVICPYCLTELDTE